MSVINKPNSKVDVENIKHNREEQGDKGGHEQGRKQSYHANSQGGEERERDPAQPSGLMIGKIVVHPETKAAVVFVEQTGITC